MLAVGILDTIASLLVMAMFVTDDVDGHRESMVVVVVDGLEEMFKLEFHHIVQSFRELQPIEEGVATHWRD